MRSEILNDLLEEAGDATHQPPPPIHGIPRQLLPGFIRQPIKWISLPFVLLDSAMQKIARKIIRPPFKREGSCKRRGNCCHYILIRSSKSILGWLFYFWQTQINGFYLRYPRPQEYEGKQMYIMGCRYLKKDGSCSQYHLRPFICREWPVIEHFGFPKVLKGCGFYSTPPLQIEETDDAFKENPLKIIQ